MLLGSQLVRTLWDYQLEMMLGYRPHHHRRHHISSCSSCSSRNEVNDVPVVVGLNVDVDIDVANESDAESNVVNSVVGINVPPIVGVGGCRWC
jgi:hypothetical protein